MGILCDYFRAPDRETAAAIVLSGPGLLEAAKARPDIEAVDLKGVDPVVSVGQLVTLLAGPSYEELAMAGTIPIDHIPGPELLAGEDGDLFVVELDVFVRDTLADATDAALDDVAFVWANTEEFLLGRDTWFEAHETRPAMDDLVAIARRARAADQMLYCVVCP